MCLRLAIEFAPGDSALSTRRATDRIDVNALHERKVKHQSVVADSPAGNVMTAAAHGQIKTVGASEVDRVSYVGVAQAAGNQRRAPIDHPVVYPAYIVIPGCIAT